jgi:hypothetical protein
VTITFHLHDELNALMDIIQVVQEALQLVGLCDQMTKLLSM